MFTKALARALVLPLTIALTSLFIQPAIAVIQSDALTISTTTYSQLVGETATASSPLATVTFLGQNPGDTYSVTVVLVSGPAGSTTVPLLRLTETSSAVVSLGSDPTPLPIFSKISHAVPAKISPTTNTYTAITAKFQVYLDSPTVNGTYVARLVPSIVGGGGTANASSQTVTFTVTGASPDSGAISIPVAETSTPDTYTASMNISSANATQLTSKSQTTSDLFVNFLSSSTSSGDTSSVYATLVSAPAGNVSLPLLELVQTSNARIDSTAQFNSALSPGAKFLAGSPAYMTAQSNPGAMSSRFKLYLANPKKTGTYVVKLMTRIESGVGTAPTKGLLVTFTVARDPDTYPVSAESVISNPGDITNKSDAEIYVSKAADTSNEVAVIRTTMRSATGLTTFLDSYTAIITGPGLIGSAPLSTDINTTGSSRAMLIKAGDAVTVYSDGTAGVATVSIFNVDGNLVAYKNLTFVDLTNQSTAILALTFSSFPEKGTPMSLTALVNLPGSVRFTTNGKVLGSCAKVVASGTPKTAVCQWRPPTSGSINIVAKFTPSDSQISPISTTKVLAIGRRTGRR